MRIVGSRGIGGFLGSRSATNEISPVPQLGERAALAAGSHRIALHAQLPARSLYERDGYRQSGKPFVEEGIDHVAMEKRIA